MKSNIYYRIIETVYKTNHIVFGFDYGFFRYTTGKYTNVVRLVNFAQCIVWSSIVWIFFKRDGFFKTTGVICGLFEYLLSSVILLQIRNGSTFYDFNIEIQKIDATMKIETSSYKCELKLVNTFILIIIHEILLESLFVIYHSQYYTLPIWVFILFNMTYVNGKIITTSNLMIFYSINCRLWKLLSILENTDDYRAMHRLYKLIATTATKYKEAYDLVFIFTLIYSIPHVMGLIILLIAEIKAGHGVINIKAELFIVPQVFGVIFAYAICGCRLTSSAEKIKVLLHNQLMTETDRMKCKDIVKFIRYVDARPMKFYVWGLLPLNASLFTIVLNFCITYIIVIAQFI